MKSGIYKILNLETGVYYIGSSKNLSHRWWKHRNQLRKNIHCNPYLQNSWNKYGEAAFSFIEVEEVSPSCLIEREQVWLDTAKQTPSKVYNLTFIAGGGDTISNHPNRTQFVQKISKIVTGAGNPMFGKTHSEETKSKWRALRKGMNVGNKHPQYGKHLSKQTKQRIAKSHSKRLWRFLSPQNQTIEIQNLAEFCRINGLNKGAMGNVFKGNASHHKQWRSANAISLL